MNAGVSMKVSGSDGKSSKKSDSKIQKDIKDLIDRRRSLILPSTSTTDESKKNPLQRFFVDEVAIARKLLNTVRSDIETLRFNDAKTPKNWLAEWQAGPKEVLPFVRSLLTRHQALESLTVSLPKRVDLSLLTRPRAFLAALKQHTARETNQPLETLRLRVNWIGENARTEWKTSIVVEGLLISGALIKRGTLSDLDADAAPVAAVPSCQITFVAEAHHEERHDDRQRSSYLEASAEDEYLDVPLYSNSQREIFICSLPVVCPREDRDNWLRRGVALHLKTT